MKHTISANHSDFERLNGEFDDLTHYNHRKRMGMDVFIIWNDTSMDKKITARFQASGKPELWNPANGESSLLTYNRISSNEIDIDLNIPAEESFLIVFKHAENKPVK